MDKWRVSNLFSRAPQTPVPVLTSERHRRLPMDMQQASWWWRCKNWLQFYCIQIRWDIERSLARLFHRRWGG